MRQPRATADFETRSACDIRETGSWRYSQDPTTEILCLAYRLPHWTPGVTGLWHPDLPGLPESPADDGLVEFLTWVESGGLVEAHNAFFERGIWKHILVPRHGWPEMGPDQWRCSAAKAAAHALPRGLEDVAEALHVKHQKLDDSASRKTRSPRTPRLAERLAWGRAHAPCGACKAKGKQKVGRAKAFTCPVCKGLGWRGSIPQMPLTWHETPELFEALFTYCRGDVLAEEAVSHALDDLSPSEEALYLLDQRINERGYGIDREAVDAALALIEVENQGLTDELILLTEGEVERATQRDRLKTWCKAQGLVLDNTQAIYLDEVLEQETLAPNVRRVLEILRALGRSSTAKYVTMREHMCSPGDRACGGMLYHGATTGRWSGRGIQPHNFPKGDVKIADMDATWRIIKTQDAEAITDFHRSKEGTPTLMAVLASALRGAIVPSPGYELFVADYAGIEARVVQWLAEDEEALAFFRTPGADPYCDMATSIFGRPIVPNKESQPPERRIGKEAILGLGFQMGAAKFAERCAASGIDMPVDLQCEDCGKDWARHDRERHAFAHDAPDTLTAAKVVHAYRSKFWRLKDMWKRQQEAAIMAVKSPHEIFCANRVDWFMDGLFLRCQLPSGRTLAYPEPRIRQKELPWGGTADSLTYMGVDQKTHQWARQWSYGGMLVENQTQAVARDILADALVRCEASGIWTPVLTVHDELVAEAPLSAKVDIHDFERLTAETAPWAEGLPIAAEGFCGPRYRK